MLLNFSCLISVALTAICIVFANGDIPTQPQTIEPPVIEKHDVTGYYRIQGAGAGGKTYVGVVYVTRPPNTQIFLVKQTVGSIASDGVGIMIDGRLVVSWKQEDDKVLGITHVRLSNGRGQARWTSIPGNGKIADESWSFLTAGVEEE